MNDEETPAEILDSAVDADEARTTTDPDHSTQYGVGPFTIREVSILGAWLIAFIVSFFPLYAGLRSIAPLSVWTIGIDWILMIGVPTVAVFLLVLRRFSPDGIRKVGSLGVDQFASVAFSVAAMVWVTYLWRGIANATDSGVFGYSWIVWVETALFLALVVLTVFAPLIPVLADDFQGRPDAAAHRNARAVRAVVARPPRPTPPPVVVAEGVESAESADAPSAPYGDAAYTPAPYAGTAATTDAASSPYARTGNTDATQTDAFDAPLVQDGPGEGTVWGQGIGAAEAVSEPVASDDVPAQEPVAQEPTADEPVAEEWSAPGYARTGSTGPIDEPAEAVSHQPFWALVPVERDVVDEQSGESLFRIGPTAWALVVADRGSSFLIRHDDGRVGVLYDVSGVTRG